MVKSLPVQVFLATPSAPTVATTSRLIGSIQCIAKADYVDGEHMAVIDDGVNPAVTFEADVAGDGAVEEQVDISGATTPASVAAILKTAIDGAGLDLVCTNAGSGLLTLRLLDNSQVGGTITETVTDADHVVTGFVTGATTQAYKVVYVDASDGVTAASSATSHATGPATLSATDYNTISGTAPAGTAAVKIYRTSGGATQGLIGTITGDLTYSLDDTGLVGDASTAPSVNTTGLGAPVDVSNLSSLYLQVSGTFTATIQIQGCITPGAWIDEGAAVTAAALPAVVESYAQLRVKMTAHTSGTPVVSLNGHRHY